MSAFNGPDGVPEPPDEGMGDPGPGGGGYGGRTSYDRTPPQDLAAEHALLRGEVLRRSAIVR